MSLSPIPSSSLALSPISSNGDYIEFEEETEEEKELQKINDGLPSNRMAIYSQHRDKYNQKTILYLMIQ